MGSQDTQLFVGPAIHSIERNNVTVIPRAAIFVSGGKIVVVENVRDNQHLQEITEKLNPTSINKLKDGQFLIPGFIDTHIHAPQFPNIGLGYDKPLLDWLNCYTFPLENEYKDIEKAKQVYKDVVKTTLKSGTTTAAYFGTVHVDSSVVLAEHANFYGQRALVGKVCMDSNSTAEMVETTENSVEDTKTFLKKIFNLQSELVVPAITPRFAVTCSESLMTQLSQLASEHDLHIQTHLAENKEEVAEVKSSFPNATSYTDVYNQANLLTRKTILAHCVHLDDSEVAMLKDKGSSVAHCPNSNVCLQSGLCDVRRLLDAGVNVSLGTDVAGGCSHMMLDAIRSCLNTSIALSFTKPDYTPLTYHEAFYLATMGGAKALDMENKLGNFEVGKDFDALIIDPQYPMRVHSKISVDELFQKFIYTGDDRNIYRTYTKGKTTWKIY